MTNRQMSHDIRFHFWRADVYRLLALSFDFPSRSVCEAVSEIAAELAESSFGDDTLRALLHDLSVQVTKGFNKREGLYHHLFTTHVACPPCEGSYQQVERGPIIGDVTAFYKAFKIKTVPGQGPPDALKMELGFMSFMCLKQAQALQNNLKEELAVTVEAQKKFLKDHLGRWGGILAGRLRIATDNPYYQILSQLLSSFIATETRMMDVKPVSLAVPLPGVADEEEVQCAM